MKTFLSLTIAGFALTLASAKLARAADTPSALEQSPGGWKDLLADAGSNLKGWTPLPIPAGATPKTTKPGSQWSLDEKTGFLVCGGEGGHEWLRWDEPVGDAIYHVEFRYTRVAGKKGYNSGIYVRNSDDAKVWHQAQIGDASGGYLFGETPDAGGGLKRFNMSKSIQGQRTQPAGEWNTVEITAKAQRLTLWVNGGVTSVFETCGLPKGFVGVEAEGYRIEFRNLKLKLLRP